jgi:hypothetical protein
MNIKTNYIVYLETPHKTPVYSRHIIDTINLRDAMTVFEALAKYYDCKEEYGPSGLKNENGDTMIFINAVAHLS